MALNRAILPLALLALLPGPARAEGDPATGEKLFRACRACHMVGEGAANRVGPHLNDLLGRPAGGIEGFRYSAAMQEADLVWDEATLDLYLADPRGVLPGTRMNYAGMEDEGARADLIAWLATFAQAEAGSAPSGAVAAILAFDADPAYGAYLASECTACHGAGGDIPRIEGLPAEQFVDGLLSYRDGRRSHPVMEMVVTRLGDAEFAALAAYFETTEATD